MKRLLALLLACLMVISLFAACGKKEEKPIDDSVAEESKADKVEDESEAEVETESGIQMSANGEVPIVEEKMEFDVVAPLLAWIPVLEENNYVNWLEEKTNIHINYQTIPSEALAEKTNLILASGNYPDGFQASAINTTLQVKYGAQEAFLNLAPLYEKYGHYLKEAYEATTYLPKAITTPEGAMYSVAAINECYHCFYAGRAWINSLWLEAIGKELPQTTDELKVVLEGFRDNDLNGNGDATDEIPFAGTSYTGGDWMAYAADWLMESFCYADYGMFTAVDPETQTIVYQPVTQEYKNGLTMIKEWYDEGLLDSEFLSLTAQELTTLGVGEEPVLGVFAAACWWSGTGDKAVMDDNGVYRERNYQILPNVEGPDGARFTFTNLSGVAENFIITKVCEYPEVLFRWVDYQMSKDASIRAFAGNWGVSIVEPDEGALGINKEPALYKVNPDRDTTNDSPNDSADNFAIANRNAAVRLGAQTDWSNEEAIYEGEVRLYLDSYNAQYPNDSHEYQVPTLVMSEEDANKRSELETPIMDYQREHLASFIIGDLSIEEDWDHYVKGFEGLRLQEYLDLLNKTYKAVYVE